MRQRVVTALLLAVPALLALALRTPWPLAAIGLVAAFIGGQEAGRLLNDRTLTAYFSALLYSIVAFPLLSGRERDYRTVAAWMAGAAVVGIATVLGASRSGKERLSLATLWTSAPLVSILVLHRSAPGGGLWCLSPALMALVPVWAGDIAAIFAGRAFGKRLLAPKISPKKTVEGSVANLAAAVLAAWLLGRLLHLSDARSLGAGLAVGVLGQAGDLFESWLKRRAGVKDSGALLPGHGGVLDRIDSVLFAAPAVALILLG